MSRDPTRSGENCFKLMHWKMIERMPACLLGTQAAVCAQHVVTCRCTGILMVGPFLQSSTLLVLPYYAKAVKQGGALAHANGLQLNVVFNEGRGTMHLFLVEGVVAALFTAWPVSGALIVLSQNRKVLHRHTSYMRSMGQALEQCMPVTGQAVQVLPPSQAFRAKLEKTDFFFGKRCCQVHRGCPVTSTAELKPPGPHVAEGRQMSCGGFAAGPLLTISAPASALG